MFKKEIYLRTVLKTVTKILVKAILWVMYNP